MCCSGKPVKPVSTKPCQQCEVNVGFYTGLFDRSIVQANVDFSLNCVDIEVKNVTGYQDSRHGEVKRNLDRVIQSDLTSVCCSHVRIHTIFCRVLTQEPSVR